jgi:hypothetical protein
LKNGSDLLEYFSDCREEDAGVSQPGKDDDTAMQKTVRRGES